MVDPHAPQVLPSAQPSATGRRLRTGVAVAVAVTAMTAGGAAWPAFFGAAPAPVAQVAPAIHAASPALLASGPVATSYADLVQTVSPAVVAVRSSRMVQQTSFSPDNPFRRFFGEEGPQGPRREAGMGSGVVVTQDGYVLTNNHVVAGAERVTVEFVDGRTLSAKVVGTDPPSDLAVLKVAGTGFKTLPLARLVAGPRRRRRARRRASARPRPDGDDGHHQRQGSRRPARSRGGYEDFLQTDAPINRGNSGGALVNLRGELVGINSQILSPTGGNIGIGFAIPSTMAHDVMTQLLERGTVRRGLLGVYVQGIDADLAKSLDLKDMRGAIVTQVGEDSAAERAGVLQGDVILSLDGKPIGSNNALRNAVARLAPGTKVTLDLAPRWRQEDGDGGARRAAGQRRAWRGRRRRRAVDARPGEAERPLWPRRRAADSGCRAAAPHAGARRRRGGGRRPGRAGQRGARAWRCDRLGQPDEGGRWRRSEGGARCHTGQPAGAAAHRAARSADLRAAREAGGLETSGPPLSLPQVAAARTRRLRRSPRFAYDLRAARRSQQGRRAAVMIVARRYLISGRVQGVGFRYFAQDAAVREGVSGFVRNRPDGRVEAHVEGEIEAVTRVERALAQGPPGARVDDLAVEPAEPTGRVSGFRVTT